MTILAYCIDKEGTDKNGILTISLTEGEKTGLQFIPSKTSLPLTSAALRKNVSPVDKSAIDFLIKEELRYLRLIGKAADEATTSFNVIHISMNQAIPALKLLSATGNLFFNGRSLATDFFGRVNFSYSVEQESSQKIRVSGRLKWGDHDISLQECDFISQGDPHWFIRGISLKLISTDIAWKDLKRLCDTAPFILEGKQKDLFLEDESAHIILKGESIPACDSFPVLILKDRVGAFADLWIDYGSGQCAPLHDPRVQITVNRQLNMESSWEKDLLETDYIKKSVDTTHYYCPVDKVSKSLLFLLEIGWHVLDWKGNRVLRQQRITLKMDTQDNFVVIKGKVHFDDFEADVSDVVGAFNRRERFVQIGSGMVGFLPANIEHLGLQTLTEEGEIVSEGIKVPKSRLGSLADLLHPQSGITATPSLTNLCDQLKEFSSIKHAPAGKSFNGSLRPYQQAGLDWLSFLWDHGFHGLLADDMGLGKTVQIIALISRLPTDKPHLIIVPTSLLFNWKKEIEKFLPGFAPYLHHGINRAKDRHTLLKQNIIVTSYATLRIDLPLMEGIHYQTVILDEAQVIKNPHTHVALSVCKLQAQLRLSITGTPIENSLQELWSHFRFLMPDLLGEESEFDSELHAAAVDSRYLQRIKRKIRPFILRRKKEEVAKDLPERIDQVVWVEMSSEQSQVYEIYLAGVRNNVLKKVDLDGISKHRIEILEAILRLRQICCHPLLVGETQSSSAKLDALMSDLETAIAEGRKVLVYSQFTSMLKLISKGIQERGWSFAYLDGQTTDREKVVASFQDNPSLPIFLISLKAGGVGLNLTAADYVFLVDPWWNDAVEEQAINRAHRIGRHDTVIAKRYVTLESIEEKMMKLKSAKKKLVEDMFDEEALAATITIEDLRALLT